MSDDLISRADAIKTAHFPVIDDASYEVVRVDDILALPSAQPVDKDINVSANDTIYRQDLVDRRAVLHIIGNAYDDSADFTSADYVRIRRQIEALPTAGRWIPCSERLPEANQTVLACGICGDEYVYTHRRFNDTLRGWEDDYGYFHPIHDVTAWMPIPEPHKGGANDPD